MNKIKENIKKIEYRCYGCGVLQEYQGYCMCCKVDKDSLTHESFDEHLESWK